MSIIGVRQKSSRVHCPGRTMTRRANWICAANPEITSHRRNKGVVYDYIVNPEYMVNCRDFIGFGTS